MDNSTATALLSHLTEAYGFNWEQKKQGHSVSYLNDVKFEVWPRKNGCFVRTLSANAQTREQWPVFYAQTEFAEYWKGPGNGTPWPDTIVTDDLNLLVQLCEDVIDWALDNRGLRAPEAKKTADEGYFEITAKMIENAVNLGAWDYLKSREALGYDSHDALITVGKSVAALQNPEAATWREHIVPCVLITEKAVSMVQSGCSSTEVAQMLKENLAIVVITQEEAKLLDSVYKTTMPAQWQWGDSVFARLDAVGIVY